MPRFKHISGLGNVQFTPEEEKARDAEEAQWKKEQEELMKQKQLQEQDNLMKQKQENIVEQENKERKVQTITL